MFNRLCNEYGIKWFRSEPMHTMTTLYSLNVAICNQVRDENKECIYIYSTGVYLGTLSSQIYNETSIFPAAYKKPNGLHKGAALRMIR